jgi:sulfite oxidase
VPVLFRYISLDYHSSKTDVSLQILRAVGSSIDRYWDIFAIHKRDDVYAVLNEYYIGDIDPQDLINGQLPCEGVDDPFVRDPERCPELIIHTAKPCNAETPTSALDTFITPNEKFYVRNHLWVPGITEVEAKEHDLAIELPDGTEKVYCLNDLRTKFSPVTITATLQCSGNRRSHLTQHAKAAHGLPWKVGAISNTEWTGVRLRDVLADAGFPVDDWNDDEVKHAQFVGAEAYGASIPIEKAVSRRGDVLLVYEMGGAPIPADHGYPLRVVVPGTTASRSVKWLKKIVLSEDECQSQWQQRDYRLAGPNQAAKGFDWSKSPAIQETPVQSAITSLAPCKEKTDMIEMAGYAFSGGGRRIVRVDVSADGGKTWHQAELLPDDAKGYKAWAWKRWKWTVPKHMAGELFVVKAIDESYNTQPDGYEAHYNFRGLLTTGWHRMEWKNVGEAAKAA